MSLSLWTNAEIVRFIGGRESTAEEVWSRLLKYAGLWSLLGVGYWVVERRETGQFLGELGFSQFSRGLGEDFDDAIEAGWAFMPAAQGQGLALEALSAAMGWLDAERPGARLVCLINPDNCPSIRLAQRLGFSRYRDAIYKEAMSELFERRQTVDAVEEG